MIRRSRLLLGEPRRIGRSFTAGFLAGYLPWLHLRFAIVMVALLVGALVLWRGQSRRRVAFLAGAAIPAALSSLYAYRITGSVLPSAVWAAEESEAVVDVRSSEDASDGGQSGRDRPGGGGATTAGSDAGLSRVGRDQDALRPRRSSGA